MTEDIEQNTGSTWGGHARLVILLILIASVPIWGSLLLLVVVSLISGSGEPMVAVPWLVLIASIKYLGHAFAAALVTAAAYLFVPRQKLKVATLVGVGLIALLACKAGVDWHHDRQGQRMSRTEAGAVTSFVSNAPELTNSIPLPVSASVLHFIERAGVPTRYAVQVRSQSANSRGTIVIVDVDRSQGGPRFKWACTTRDTFGWERSDPCARAD